MSQGTFLLIGDDYISDFNWQKRIPLFEVHSYGAPQERVEKLLQRLNQIEKTAPVPDIILLITGIQNVIAKDYTFVDQIRRIVIRLSNQYPSAEIIINSLPNIRTHFLVEDAITHLNLGLKDIAQNTGCCFLDNFIATDKNRNSCDIFLKDGIHLTEQAYDTWAKSFLEYVAFLFEDA